MYKSKKSRRFKKSVDLSDVVLRGDLVIKAGAIVKESQKPGSGLPRIHSVEEFLEVAFEETVAKYERMLGEIVVAESGLTARIKPSNGDDASNKSLSDSVTN